MSCHEDLCITCSDEAIPVIVVALLPDGMATVRIEDASARGKIEEVSIELVEANVGDRVLVHAGVAIARLP